MKLNLLPVSVTKRSTAPIFIGIGCILLIASILASIFLINSSKKALEDAKANRAQYLAGYANNKATAASAEEVVKKAVDFDRNVKLYEAMAKHNNTYPDFYQSLKPFIPGFYRLTAIRATPAGTQAAVTMVGQVETFQQYTDLALALWRVPKVISVQRAGFVPNFSFAQSLERERQKTIFLKNGEQPIPDDDVQAIEIYKQRAAAERDGYLNVGNFGTENVPKGAMPEWATVTMTLLIDKNLQTPDPAATLRQAGGAGGGAAGAPGAPAGGGRPAGGGGLPPSGGGLPPSGS